MHVETICFGALVPAAGYRWIYRDPKGKWYLRQPPEDWPETDYQAFRYDEDLPPNPELSDRFYIAAGTVECLIAHADQKTEFGKLISEPELYLRFASERPTPSLILEFANRYGLLSYEKSHFCVRRCAASELVPTFDRHVVGMKPVPELLFVTGEKASDWLSAFEHARFKFRDLPDLQAAGGFAAMSAFLNDGYNCMMGGSLTYQVRMDEQTGQVRSELIASSLQNLLEIQWGMSLAAGIIHRQCAECPAWFSVHPGSGRPEKQYCSDACRMRAYRKRKAQVSRRRTRKKSQRSL